MRNILAAIFLLLALNLFAASPTFQTFNTADFLVNQSANSISINKTNAGNWQFATNFSTINSNVVYTSPWPGGLLVGSIAFVSDPSHNTNVVLTYTNNGVAGSPVVFQPVGSLTSGNSAIPFSIPLAKGATFQFSVATGIGQSQNISGTLWSGSGSVGGGDGSGTGVIGTNGILSSVSGANAFVGFNPQGTGTVAVLNVSTINFTNMVFGYVLLNHNGTNTPYPSLELASAASVSNDTFKVLGGNLNVSNTIVGNFNDFDLGGNTLLFWDVTNNAACIDPNNSSVHDGTIRCMNTSFNQGTIGCSSLNGDPAFTNAVLYNLIMIGASDCLLDEVNLYSCPGLISHDNVYISGFDVVAHQSTNDTWSFNGDTFTCNLNIISGSTPAQRGFQSIGAFQNNNIIKNCHFKSGGSSATNTQSCLSLGGIGSNLVMNCDFQMSSSNLNIIPGGGTPIIVVSSGAGTLELKDCYIDGGANVLAGIRLGTGVTGYLDGDVVMPNSVSNQVIQVSAGTSIYPRGGNLVASRFNSLTRVFGALGDVGYSAQAAIPNGYFTNLTAVNCFGNADQLTNSTVNITNGTTHLLPGQCNVRVWGTNGVGGGLIILTNVPGQVVHFRAATVNAVYSITNGGNPITQDGGGQANSWFLGNVASTTNGMSTICNDDGSE